MPLTSNVSICDSNRSDVPLVWYQGAAVRAATRRYLHANWQGSIAGIAQADGTIIAINGYDAYGIGNEPNIGRFQYTGQAWLAELGLYYYKAGIYSPTLGRFLQTDPIGYEDQFNLYAYVKNDPVNGVDPSGMDSYLVSRPLDSEYVSAFGHAYVVTNAEYVGDPNATVISFGELKNGNTGNVTDGSRASDRSATAGATDTTHWRGLSPKTDANQYSRIDARDTTVAAVAGAVKENTDYDPVPGFDMLGGNPATNSNAAAVAVTNRATSISRGQDTALPSARPLPGANEAGRIKFDETKLCDSDGIKC